MRALQPLHALLVLYLLLAGCQNEHNHSPTWTWNLPQGFPTPQVPQENPMSKAKVKLGRHLFYETRLSITGDMSCATCHQQERAFADEKARGIGATGEEHTRGSMSLTNVAYNARHTWADPDMDSLEEQALVPLLGESPVEMGLKDIESQVMQQLKEDPLYQTLFAEAWPEEKNPFTLQNITRALASFERTLISGHSPYDRYTHGDTTALSASAQRGATLFFSERLECFHCHGGFNFADSTNHEGKRFEEFAFHNTGLYDLDETGAYPAEDTGLHQWTQKPEDMGKFKAPTLRNIAVTAPYMHDGSITTLKEVIEHYAQGGRAPQNPYKSEFVAGFVLTEEETEDLIAFLESLTDETFLTNPALSNPFQ